MAGIAGWIAAARSAADENALGAAHHEIVVTPRELVAHLEYLVACRDAPVSRPSDLALCRLASEAGRRVKTVLTGDGCDEVLGGYRRYVAEVLCGGVQAFPARLLAPLVSAGRFDTAAGPLRLNGVCNSLFTRKTNPPEKNPDADPKTSPLRRALYIDQTTWLPDQLLERIDRAAAGVDALPAPLARRAKGGWRLDVAGWLRDELREFALDHLHRTYRPG